jgi:dTDP-4-dehydrorhamnose 3,5-epimerase
MARFNFIATPMSGLTVVERQQLGDARGYLSRLFCAAEMAEIGFELPVAQINQTLTRQPGAVRGLHFQHPPHAEDKLVTCLHGQIFDVAVDLRSGSATFLKWHGEVLSGGNHRSLFIPQGFAHGFQALTDNCELLYLHTRPYAASAEAGVNPVDPVIGIEWPLAFTDMSERDRNHPFLSREFPGIQV